MTWEGIGVILAIAVQSLGLAFLAGIVWAKVKGLDQTVSLHEQKDDERHDKLMERIENMSKSLIDVRIKQAEDTGQHRIGR